MQLGLPFTSPAPSLPPESGPPPVPGSSRSKRGQARAGSRAGPADPEPLDALEFVRHPRARRYVIRVSDDGTVRVTIPRGGSKREAADFARRQRAWIDKERVRVAQNADRSRETTPPDIERELRTRAARDLPPRLLELAAEHGLTVSRISVRNQRWRWGSCSRRGHICLNWRLVRMPPEIRDYVMVHELMHLKRMDHSRRFWKLVADACPDYHRARQWLREYGRLRES